MQGQARLQGGHAGGAGAVVGGVEEQIRQDAEGREVGRGHLGREHQPLRGQASGDGPEPQHLDRSPCNAEVAALISHVEELISR